jgi:hypothetical protein
MLPVITRLGSTLTTAEVVILASMALTTLEQGCGDMGRRMSQR